MNFGRRLRDAFVHNNVNMAVVILTEEKSSVTLVDRLDDVVIKELHKHEHKNVALVLRAIENLITKDEDCIHKLVHNGLVAKTASEYLKAQPKPSKDALKLIEVFYEISMSLCQITIAGGNKILDVFLLRFGAVVLDYEVPFCLRLEAIRTMNSMLDSSPKDIRKKLCHSNDHIGLLEDLAKVLTDIGDYEMQVAISEALCRMTPRKLRGDFAGKWFNFRSFASAFTSIRDKDFETDCRTFLNELNSYFGGSSRVFSFPCIQAFLDSTELLKPEDEFLQEFWVDFNLGTSTITFFVNDPQNTLWELIHLPKDIVRTYDVQECDDRKILTVHLTTPLCHRGITGKMVKIIFSSVHNIETALLRVFGEKPHYATVSKDTLQSGDGLTMTEGPQHEEPVIPCMFTSSPAGEFKSIHRVAHAKTMLFCQTSSTSSNGSTKSLPDTLGRTPVKKKMRMTHSDKGFPHKGTPQADYHRRKPRAKGKLRVLPLSSPSSNEEDFSKLSIPKGVQEIKNMASEYDDWFEHKLEKSFNMQSSSLKDTTADSGFQNKTVSESSLQADELDLIEEEHILDKGLPSQRSEAIESPELHVRLNGETEVPKQPTFPPRKPFLPGPLEDAAERVTEALMEGEESEEELGAGVRNAFNSFKIQLRAHFSSRYKKIEARTLQSFTDCQRNVTSLLGTVHNQRLLHLEQFQNTVVHQLECLEQDCLSLKTIEKETVNFWQSESDTVRTFCDRQQNRLHSLLLPETSAQPSSFSVSAQRETKSTVPPSPQEQSPMMVPVSETTTTDL